MQGMEVEALSSTTSTGGRRSVRRSRASRVSSAASRRSMAGIVGVADTTGEAMKSFTEDDTVPEGLSFNEAVSNLVIALIGAAVVTFPRVMANTGWLFGPPLLLITAVCLMECGKLICEGCAAGDCIKSYEDYASFVGGQMMKNVLMVTKNAVMLGTIILFATFQTNAIAGFLPGKKACKPNAKIRFFLVMPVFVALSMIKDLKVLARFSFLGIIAVCMECVGMLAGSVENFFYEARCQNQTQRMNDDLDCRWYSMYPPPGNKLAEELGTAMSVFVFGFAVLATIPGLRSQLRDPSDMPGAFRKALIIALATYMFLMILAYSSFGEKVDDNVISDISSSYPKVGAIPAVGILINISFSFPIFFFCVSSAFEASGNDPIRTPMTPQNKAARAGLVVVLVLISHILPFVVEVTGVISSIFCCCNNIFFPVAFFYMAAKKAYVPAQPTWSKPLHAIVVVAGVCVMWFGFKGSVETLVNKLKQNETTPVSCDA